MNKIKPAKHGLEETKSKPEGVVIVKNVRVIDGDMKILGWN